MRSSHEPIIAAGGFGVIAAGGFGVAARSREGGYRADASRVLIFVFLSSSAAHNNNKKRSKMTNTKRKVGSSEGLSRTTLICTLPLALETGVLVCDASTRGWPRSAATEFPSAYWCADPNSP